MIENSTTMPPPAEMPITFLTLPRELRDEILTYAALSPSFTFLRTCRQLNEEGTPLLYRHGIYHMRVLTLCSERRAREQLPAPCEPPPIHLVQNLHFTMPPIQTYRTHYELPQRTIALLEQLGATEIRRRVCQFDLQFWPLSPDVAKGLGGLVGFEVVRLQVRSREKERDQFVRVLDEWLGSALGKAKWETKESVMFDKYGNDVDILVAEFRPGDRRGERGHGIDEGIIERMAEGAFALDGLMTRDVGWVLPLVLTSHLP